jgi:hypothetical protein
MFYRSLFAHYIKDKAADSGSHILITYYAKQVAFPPVKMYSTKGIAVLLYTCEKLL